MPSSDPKRTGNVYAFLRRAGCLFLLLTFVFGGLYLRLRAPWMLSVAVTMFTIAYHFLMRLCVGWAVARVYRDHAPDPAAPHFRVYGFEKKLYAFLRVRRWKGKLLTADPDAFDPRKVGLEGLLRAMLTAEMTHRVIMLLSFAPMLLILPFGEPPVFALTSLAACAADAVFVIVQRYNRPRIAALIERRKHVHPV